MKIVNTSSYINFQSARPTPSTSSVQLQNSCLDRKNTPSPSANIFSRNFSQFSPVFKSLVQVSTLIGDVHTPPLHAYPFNFKIQVWLEVSPPLPQKKIFYQCCYRIFCIAELFQNCYYTSVQQLVFLLSQPFVLNHLSSKFVSDIPGNLSLSGMELQKSVWGGCSSRLDMNF